MKFERKFEKFIVDSINDYLRSIKDKESCIFKTFDNLVKVDAKGSEFEVDIFMDTLCNEVQAEVFEPRMAELEKMWRSYNKGLSPEDIPCRMDGSILLSKQDKDGIKIIRLDLDVIFVEISNCLQFDVCYSATTDSNVMDLPYRSDDTSCSIDLVRNTVSIYAYLEEHNELEEEGIEWGDDLDD